MQKRIVARFCTLAATDAGPLYADVPRPCRDKSARKPYPTPMKTLIQRAKAEKAARKANPCRMLEHPPDNGLLVPELVNVAHLVHDARESLIRGISQMIELIPIHRCKYCWEVHVGQRGHELRTCDGSNCSFRGGMHVWSKGGVRNVVFFPTCFHLFDRVGKPRVGHDERLEVPRLPAIVELCIQAGLDLPKYPMKRRTKPVYSIDGRIVDFEAVNPNDDVDSEFSDSSLVCDPCFETKANHNDEYDSTLTNSSLVSNPGFETIENHNADDSRFFKSLLASGTGIEKPMEDGDMRELSIRTLTSWFDMISGTKKLMRKYKVWTCGYCPEVQVGPKGHKTRMCKASKHQSRDGMHAWQEATIDDVVGPNYVWHVSDPNEVLHNDLKMYYGKAPAVVEMCVRGGAPVPDEYRSMMRLDVVPLGRDEVDLAA